MSLGSFEGGKEPSKNEVKNGDSEEIGRKKEAGGATKLRKREYINEDEEGGSGEESALASGEVERFEKRFGGARGFEANIEKSWNGDEKKREEEAAEVDDEMSEDFGDGGERVG